MRVEDHPPVGDRSTPGRRRADASMSSCSIRRPPISTSTLATLLTSPPAEKPTNTSSILVAGDPLGLLDRLADRDLGLLHVGDEAALDAAALALAGAEDRAGAPSSPGSAISARDLGRADVERGDQVRGRGLDGRGAPSDRPRQVVRRLRRGRARGGGARARWRRARARSGYRRGAGSRMSNRTKPRPSSCVALVHAARTWSSALRAAASPSGRASTSPRLEAQVPAAAADPGRAGDHAACSCGAASSRRVELGDMAVGAGADHQRQIGHRVEPHRLEHARRRRRSGVSCWLCCQIAAGCALDDVDDQRVGQPARDPRVARPSRIASSRCARRRRDRPAASPSNAGRRRRCRLSSRVHPVERP